MESSDLYKRLWFSLNRAFPRKLWAMTTDVLVNGTTAEEERGSYQQRRIPRRNITQDDLALDPLQVHAINSFWLGLILLSGFFKNLLEKFKTCRYFYVLSSRVMSEFPLLDEDIADVDLYGPQPPTGSAHDMDMIETPPVDESISTELRHFAWGFVRDYRSQINRALDTTLREHFEAAVSLLRCRSSLSLAELARCLLTLRDDFERCCPKATARLLSLAADPSASEAFSFLSSTGLIQTLLNTVACPSEHRYARMGNPIDALESIGVTLTLALTLTPLLGSHLVTLLCFTVSLVLTLYLALFSRWYLITGPEALQLAQAGASIWSVGASALRRGRERFDTLDVTDEAVKTTFISAAVAVILGHLWDIGLTRTTCLALLVLLFLFLPLDIVDVVRDTASALPSVKVTKDNAKILGFGSGMLGWHIIRHTSLADVVFRMALNLAVHSFLKRSERL